MGEGASSYLPPPSSAQYPGGWARGSSTESAKGNSTGLGLTPPVRSLCGLGPAPQHLCGPSQGPLHVRKRRGCSNDLARSPVCVCGWWWGGVSLLPLLHRREAEGPQDSSVPGWHWDGGRSKRVGVEQRQLRAASLGPCTEKSAPGGGTQFGLDSQPLPPSQPQDLPHFSDFAMPGRSWPRWERGQGRGFGKHPAAVWRAPPPLPVRVPTSATAEQPLLPSSDPRSPRSGGAVVPGAADARPQGSGRGSAALSVPAPLARRPGPAG